MRAQPQPAVVALPVRVREVVTEACGIVRKESVFCPSLGRSVSLDECLLCPDFQGLDVDSEEGAAVVCMAVDPDVAGVGRELEPQRGLAGPGDCTPVREVMTTRVLCVRPEVRRFELEALLLERNISGCPVVDEAGRPLGIVSKTDLVAQRHYAGLGPAQVPTAADLMTPVAFSVHENTSVAQAAALMAYEGIHRLPVVGNDGAVVGIIAPLDVLGWLARQHGYVMPT